MPAPRHPREPEDLLGNAAGRLLSVPNPDRPKTIVYTAFLAVLVGIVGFFGCGIASGSMGFVYLDRSTYTLDDGTVAPFPKSVAQSMAILGSVDLALSVGLIVAGVGGYSIRPWARRIGLVVAPLMILAAIARLILFLTLIGPQEVAMHRLAELHPASQPTTTSAVNPSTAASAPSTAPVESTADKLEANTLTVGMVTFIAQVAVPLMILAFWSRSSIQEIFEKRRQL